MTRPTSPEPDTSRREFLETCARALPVLVVVGAASSLVEGCVSSKSASAKETGRLDVDVSELETDGATLLTDPVGEKDSPVLVVRSGANSYQAFSTLCTHKFCVLNPPSGGELFCKCHGSKFDLAGNVLKGPAKTSLRRYGTTYDQSSKTLTVLLTELKIPE